MTIEAAETLCMVCVLPEEHIFRKKNTWVIDLSKDHILQGFDHQICIFTNLSKTVRKHSSSFGSTSSVLLTLPKKNYDTVDLKIELLATNVNIASDFRYFRFFFVPVK